MDKNKAKALIDRYLNGTCTPEEKILLDRFYYEHAAKKKISASPIDASKLKSEIWDEIELQIVDKQLIKRKLYYRISAAAAVLVVLGVGFLFFSKDKANTVLSSQQTKVAILPASQKAILTLADGSNIVLDEANHGTISTQAGGRVFKTAKGDLVYQNQSAVPKEQQIVYNKLTTPKGGYHHITLSDGSQVWLNSASSITFPAFFSGRERLVKITGEAYFEVAKNKDKPFIVQSGSQSIQVLGTHFNVEAYDDDAASITTLLEGSVRLTKQSSSVMLKPGQAASNLIHASTFKVAEVNVDDAIAWKQGYFKFNKESLTNIMKKLSRWYNVEVIFEDNVGAKAFWGTYSRTKKLNDLLQDLEQTDDVSFKIDGRRITVMK